MASPDGTPLDAWSIMLRRAQDQRDMHLERAASLQAVIDAISEMCSLTRFGPSAGLEVLTRCERCKTVTLHRLGEHALRWMCVECESTLAAPPSRCERVIGG